MLTVLLFSLKEKPRRFFRSQDNLKGIYLTRSVKKRKKESTYHSLPQILMSHPCVFALWRNALLSSRWAADNSLDKISFSKSETYSS